VALAGDVEGVGAVMVGEAGVGRGDVGTDFDDIGEVGWADCIPGDGRAFMTGMVFKSRFGTVEGDL
jgi:hypothetical protein